MRSMTSNSGGASTAERSSEIPTPPNTITARLKKDSIMKSNSIPAHNPPDCAYLRPGGESPLAPTRGPGRLRALAARSIPPQQLQAVTSYIKARRGIEPLRRGFADPSVTTSPRGQKNKKSDSFRNHSTIIRYLINVSGSLFP